MQGLFMKKDEFFEAYMLELIATGATIKESCEQLQRSNSYLIDYRHEFPDFDQKYKRARENGLDMLGDSLMEVNRIERDPQRARILSDNIKWYLSKHRREVYGDKVDINVNQKVSITSALAEAKGRLKDITPISADKSITYEHSATDTISDGRLLEHEDEAQVIDSIDIFS